MELRQAELEDWQAHPVTQQLLQALRLRQQELLDRWAAGYYLSDNPYVTQGANAKAVGAMEVYDLLLNNLDKVFSDD